MDPISARKSFFFFYLARSKMLTVRSLRQRRMTKNTFEYLGEFYFIFETNLGYKTGDQMCSFNEKNRDKIS
jgi:hypothetical protein